MLHAARKMCSHSPCRLRPFLLNVILDLTEIGNSLLGPDYLHEGRGSLRLLPQDCR